MADINDKFGRASDPSDYAPITTVRGSRTVGESVLTGYDLSDFDADTPAFFITYKKSIDPTTGEVSSINQAGWKAIVNKDNNTFTNLTLAPGYTDYGHADGDYIEAIPTSFWANELIDGITKSLLPNGKIKPEAAKEAMGDDGHLVRSLDEMFGDGVVNGVVFTHPATGRTTDYTAGVSYLGGKRFPTTASNTTLGASRDSYIRMNADGTLTPISVANGAAMPAPPDGTMYIQKIVTDANNITSSTPMNRGVIKAQNVDFTTLGLSQYNTTETDTNSTWIDGKKIYRKVVSLGNLPNNTAKSVPHGIVGIGYILRLSGTLHNAVTKFYEPIPAAYPGTTNSPAMIGMYIDNANIMVSTGRDRSMETGVAILEYTKV